MKIGFIGLGIMGKPMVRNLIAGGYTDVLVWNRSRPAIEACVSFGAAEATPRQIGTECDVVITMLPDSPQVKEVMLGTQGLAQYMKPGAVFVDCSSINPVVSREIYGVLQEKGVEMLDAPVSGGEPKAIDGTLSFMVGGKESVFLRLKPLLLTMGSSAVRCGEVGAGNTAKLANRGSQQHLGGGGGADPGRKSRGGPEPGVSGHPGRLGRLRCFGGQGPHDADW